MRALSYIIKGAKIYFRDRFIFGNEFHQKELTETIFHIMFLRGVGIFFRIFRKKPASRARAVISDVLQEGFDAYNSLRG